MRRAPYPLPIASDEERWRRASRWSSRSTARGFWPHPARAESRHQLFALRRCPSEAPPGVRFRETTRDTNAVEEVVTRYMALLAATAIACGSGRGPEERTNESTNTRLTTNQPPIGWVDSVTSAAGSSIVHPTDNVVARGWAADWEDGTTPTHVTVSVDGKVAGTVTASNPRPDVAAYFANPAFANTGWSLALDISGLSLGSHTVTAVATDSAGATSAIGSLDFYIFQR